MLAQIGNCCTEQLCCVNDAVCCTIILDDTGGTALPIWDDATTFVINGTIMVENNGTAVGGFVVAPGECRSITMNDINSIAIVGAGTGTSSVKISFSINYKF